MTQSDDWEVFRTYTDQGSAEVMCTRLKLDNVPARVETRSLENAREQQRQGWQAISNNLAKHVVAKDMAAK
jgi:hypothetical protein